MWFVDEYKDKLFSCQSCTKRNTCTKKEYNEKCHDLDMEVYKQLRTEAINKFKSFLSFIPPDIKRDMVNFIFLIAFTLLVFIFYL